MMLSTTHLGAAPSGLLPPSVLGGADLWCADGDAADRICPTEEMCYYECPGGEQPLPRSGGGSGETLITWLEANQTAVLIGGAVLLGLVLLGGRRR